MRSNKQGGLPMLLLSRRNEEYITITTPDDQEIIIKVVSAEHGKVKLGFDAPQNFLILRNELQE